MNVKKLLCAAVLLALVINLCGCAPLQKGKQFLQDTLGKINISQFLPKAPSPEPAPEVTTAPDTEPVTEPVTEPATEATTEPPTEPPTEAPTKPRKPMSEVPYILTLPREGRFVYQEPSYDSPVVQPMPHGAFTVVEEVYDGQNFLWGKLKSGIGWICLDDIAVPEPLAKGIYAGPCDYALLLVENYYVFHSPESTGTDGIFIQALEDMRDVTIVACNDVSGEETYVLSRDTLNAGEAIVLNMPLPYEFGFISVHYVDSQGFIYTYGIFEDYSGDGPLYYAQYLTKYKP